MKSHRWPLVGAALLLACALGGCTPGCGAPAWRRNCEVSAHEWYPVCHVCGGPDVRWSHARCCRPWSPVPEGVRYRTRSPDPEWREVR